MVDALITVENLLDNNWNETNTPKPRIFYNEDGKTTSRINDFGIKLYEPSPRTLKAAGLGISHREEVFIVSIDAISFRSRAQAIAMMDEVERIMNNNLCGPDSDFDTLEVDQRNDQSSSANRFWHFITDVRLRRLARIRNT